jgi:hypothetical protein
MGLATLNLRNTVNFAASFLKNQPQQVTNMEPALTAANCVLGAMLGPPMKWRQNRAEINFAIASSGTDFVQVVQNFGFIEYAWLVDGSNNQYSLDGKLYLTINPTSGRPEKVAAQFDDNDGNITFRFDKKPDASYTCYIGFQQTAPSFTSMASTWGPIPDYFQYIFNFGYLAIVALITNDSRFPIYEKWFIGRLLAAQSGLTEQEKNIFLSNWMATISTLKKSGVMDASGLGGN